MKVEEGGGALNAGGVKGGGRVGGKRARTDAGVVKAEDGALNKASLEHLMSA